MKQRYIRIDIRVPFDNTLDQMDRLADLIEREFPKNCAFVIDGPRPDPERHRDGIDVC